MSDAVNEGSPADRLAKSHLSLGVRKETLSDFLNQLKTSPHTEHLETWVRASDVRQDLFAHAAIGRIKWSKAIGRPDAPQLFAGFVFPQFWVDVWHIGLDGSIVTDIEGWMPGEAPSVWDGGGDSDHFSVGYMVYAANENDNLIEVRLSNVQWSHPAHRYLSSPGWRFYNAGKFTSLPDIVVDSQPFFHP
jgi:hypothetical protein